MTVWEIITNFFQNAGTTDWLILGALILVPFITIVLIVVAIVNGRKRRAVKETAEAPAAAPEATEEPKEGRRIRYITTKAPEHARVRVRVKNLCKVDQSLLIATGIFGVSLGLMIQRAVDDEFRC